MHRNIISLEKKYTLNDSTWCPDLTSHMDYYPGGAALPGRTWIGGDEYRYSHNSHEREDEIYGGAQSAEHWMYDSRILRRWEIDPVVKPWESPYAVFSNNPVYFADPLGLDSKDPKENSGKANGDKLENGQTAKVTEPGATVYGDGDNTRSLGKTEQEFNSECNCYIDKSLTEPSGESGGGNASGTPDAQAPKGEVAPRDNTNRPDDNINRGTSSADASSWWAKVIKHFDNQQNKSEITTPIRTNFYGVQPTTTTGPTKNLGFSSPTHFLSINLTKGTKISYL
jgi:hypothetical protein